MLVKGFPGGASGKETACLCRCKRCRFHPWVWKIPWRRANYKNEKHGGRWTRRSSSMDDAGTSSDFEVPTPLFVPQAE